MKQFSLTHLRDLSTFLDAHHTENVNLRSTVQAQIERLETKVASWVALLEPKLQRIEYRSALRLEGYMVGAREDEDIAQEVVRLLEARYSETWLIKAEYGYGDYDKCLDYNPPWIFRFTRK